VRGYLSSSLSKRSGALLRARFLGRGALRVFTYNTPHSASTHSVGYSHRPRTNVRSYPRLRPLRHLECRIPTVSGEYERGSPMSGFDDIEEKHRTRLVREGQPHIDRVLEKYKGQPVEVVLPHMREAMRLAGITPDNEAEVRTWAQRVTDGHRTELA